MQTPHEDPLVTLADIAEVRSQLYRRWVPIFLKLGLKLIALGALGAVVLYVAISFVRPEWSSAFAFRVVVLLELAITVAPMLVYVTQCLWLDRRLAHRLDSMAQRVHAGEAVRASDVVV
jgi:hypothetical protein